MLYIHNGILKISKWMEDSESSLTVGGGGYRQVSGEEMFVWLVVLD